MPRQQIAGEGRAEVADAVDEPRRRRGRSLSSRGPPGPFPPAAPAGRRCRTRPRSTTGSFPETKCGRPNRTPAPDIPAAPATRKSPARDDCQRTGRSPSRRGTNPRIAPIGNTAYFTADFKTRMVRSVSLLDLLQMPRFDRRFHLCLGRRFESGLHRGALRAPGVARRSGRLFARAVSICFRCVFARSIATRCDTPQSRNPYRQAFSIPREIARQPQGDRF